MKLKDIKLKTCPFCDGEGVLIHSKPDDGYIYSEGVHAFVKCKECDACGPMPDVEYNHAASGNPGRLKAINKAIELAVKVRDDATNEDIEKAINVAYLDDDCEVLEQRLHEITNIKVEEK